MPLSCRFYAQKYPEVEDVVMVKMRTIADMGAYVYLLEYNNIEGMILLSELSRRRIRSINKIIRVGKVEPVVVIRVDKEKGYIDLSKRRVSPEDVEKCTEKYSKAKAVHSLLRHVAEILEMDDDEEAFEDLYRKTAWRYEEKTGRQGSSYDFFKQAVLNPAMLAECDLDERTQQILLENIQNRLTSQAVKIRSDIEVSCYGYEGIDAVKNALRAGLTCSNEEMAVKINLIAPPQYVVTTSTPERQNGLQLLNEALEKIKKVITEYGGVFNVKMGPKVVTDVDEVELQKQMLRAEMENAEVGGDDDDSGGEDDEGMGKADFGKDVEEKDSDSGSDDKEE